MKSLKNLVRENIYNLTPYSCARNDFKGEASTFLDANENPMNEPYNRYPDPLQVKVKEKIAKIKGVRPTQIMLGNGSDEPIDLVCRIFCDPKTDNMVAIDPTYGMYGVCADINNVEYRKVLLNNDYTLDAQKVLAACDEHTKVIWLCSPNNPTGNSLDRNEMTKIVNLFDGIVIIDEAYIDFSSEKSWLTDLDNYSNLIILQTFSKAWGMAGVRCGMAFASEEIIEIFNKVKYPYNINILTQKLINEALEQEERKINWVNYLLDQRTALIEELGKLKITQKIFPTNANFILVKVMNADGIYNTLISKGIVVRNRNTVSLCGNCLRITVGTEEENKILLSELQRI